METHVGKKGLPQDIHHAVSVWFEGETLLVPHSVAVLCVASALCKNVSHRVQHSGQGRLFHGEQDCAKQLVATLFRRSWKFGRRFVAQADLEAAILSCAITRCVTVDDGGGLVAVSVSPVIALSLVLAVPCIPGSSRVAEALIQFFQLHFQYVRERTNDTERTLNADER